MLFDKKILASFGNRARIQLDDSDFAEVFRLQNCGNESIAQKLWISLLTPILPPSITQHLAFATDIGDSDEAVACAAFGQVSCAPLRTSLSALAGLASPWNSCGRSRPRDCVSEALP